MSTLEDDDDHDGDSDDEATASPAMRYAFPELDSQIRAAIDEYDGAVFPKLNFSSPKVRLYFLFLFLLHPQQLNDIYFACVLKIL
jgi:hypothetical protein